MREAITAKELKNHTGDVLRRVRAGQSVVITHRGRPIAVVSPADGDSLHPADADAGSLAAIWADIEATLRETAAEHPTWQDALGASRGRP